ncbi:hypothetical protein T484DRAFT_1624600, partial [Baffinella frigidus]
RNPKPETRNPKPEIRNPKPETPEPETRNPKPEIRNPKPEIRNPKSETRNPKPETRGEGRFQNRDLYYYHPGCHAVRPPPKLRRGLNRCCVVSHFARGTVRDRTEWPGNGSRHILDFHTRMLEEPI